MKDLLTHIFAFDANTPLLFTQFYFWAFFAIVYAFFALFHSKRLLRNSFLFFVSLFFYYKTSGIFILILLFVTCSDFLIAKRIYAAQKQEKNTKAKIWLCLSIITDLSLLCYFKYAYFLTNMVNDMFSTNLQVFDIFAWIGNGFCEHGRFCVDKIVLPVGISFYLFQVISYTVDVFKRKIEPVNNLLDFGFYVSFFPQLVAGPIVRASEFIPQLYRPFCLSRRQFGLAVFWILNGLVKKIVLSDYLAVQYIDRVFDNPLLFSGFENLFALFAYSLQVYADFSGYTDIAIGLAMLMGFYLPKNFNSPYKATNPQDFWRRWHMSLSRWLKTYLYIPLGGNRNATPATYILLVLFALIAVTLTGNIYIGATILIISLCVVLAILFLPQRRKKIYANLNSFITMLIGGLWHGASWNFIIWGGLNGIGMIIYKIWKDCSWHIRMALMTLAIVAIITIRHFYTTPFTNVCLIWIICLCVATAIRYLYFLLMHLRFRHTDSREDKAWVKHIATMWAVVQTFTFITFTRLFFRAGSNLDPATANREAWQTATQMITQIGSKWDWNLLPQILTQYAGVIVLFLVGMLIHWLPDKFKQWYRLSFASLPTPVIAGVAVLVVFFVYQFITADLQAFIYFQF